MQRHWGPSLRPPMGHAPGYNMCPRPRFDQNDMRFCNYRPHMPPPPPSSWCHRPAGPRGPAISFPPTANHSTVPHNFHKDDAMLDQVHNSRYSRGRGRGNFKTGLKRPMPTKEPAANYPTVAHNFHKDEAMLDQVHNSTYSRGHGRGNFKRGLKRTMPTKEPVSKKKKIKENKKERDATTCPFYCKSCDKGYMSEQTYKEHCDSHMKCPGEECSYVAATKLVKLHYDMQHKTGLAKKIWKLESKEDIEKWREERRKNFPTKENIERKRNQLAERKSRGEVMVTKQFGKMKGGQQRRDMTESGGAEIDEGLDIGEGGGRRKRRRNQQRRRQNKKHGRGQQTGPTETDSTAPSETKTPPDSSEKTYSAALDPLAYVIAEDKDVSDVDSLGGDADNDPPTQVQAETATSGHEETDPSLHRKQSTGQSQSDPLQAVYGGSDTQEQKPQLTPQPDISHKAVTSVGALGALASLYADTSDDEEETDHNDYTLTTLHKPSVAVTSEGSKRGSVCKEGCTTQSVCKKGGDMETGSDGVNSDKQTVVDTCTADNTVNTDMSTSKRPVKQDGEIVGDTDSKSVKKDGQNKKSHQRNKSKKCGDVKRPGVARKRLTLLQRLLAPDIRHERNVVLQCIRHIVNNDFLGVQTNGGQQSVPEETRKLQYGEDELWDDEYLNTKAGVTG